MAGKRGREGVTVAERLLEEPYRFDFFQAVRLLELIARSGSHDESSPRRKSVGRDHAPDEEVVRFRSLPSRGFPSSPIKSLQPADGRLLTDASGPPPEMQVTFMGLTGPSGVLPQHYTQLVIDRLRVNDSSLRDYLDLFHHRVISLFYRAWEKYRFPYSHERAARADDGNDDGNGGDDDSLFTFAMYCCVGLGFPSLRRRMNVADETILYYAGHFAQSRPSAATLEQIVADYFGVPAEVQQFFGQWFYLSERRNQSKLPSADCPAGRNNQLGLDTIAGERVWNVPSKFRIRLGPLSYSQFRDFIPGRGRLQTLSEIVRLYVGAEFDFDVQLILRSAEVPWCQLDSDSSDPARLGWNTWIRSSPLQDDVGDAVFVVDGMPQKKQPFTNPN